MNSPAAIVAAMQEMWEWNAGQHCRGVCGNEGRALDAVERYLGVGENARVERVVPFLSFRTMSSYYQPTGYGWTATRDRSGQVDWRRL
jgi:hypothetical protein